MDLRILKAADKPPKGINKINKDEFEHLLTFLDQSIDNAVKDFLFDIDLAADSEVTVERVGSFYSFIASLRNLSNIENKDRELSGGLTGMSALNPLEDLILVADNYSFYKFAIRLVNNNPIIVSDESTKYGGKGFDSRVYEEVVGGSTKGVNKKILN